MPVKQNGHTAFRWLTAFFWLGCLGLFFFSFTQVDLNLTLSRVGMLQTIQKAFQYVGFYARGIATAWFVIDFLALTVAYWFILRLIQKYAVPIRFVWYAVGGVVLILVFSYPAFSYDIFNYMFTAKTVLVYHKNPYAVIPLQFAGVEPWLSFMRWTHLPSAYTPLWIAATLPAYVLGFGKFILVLWNIKLLVAGCYVGVAWFISKILERTDRNQSALGVAIFALNPLVIIETLVSGHNDMMMMVIVMAAVYAALLGKKFLSLFLLALSVAAKLMTIFLYPVALFFRWNRYLMLLAMCIGLFLVVIQREVLGWYLVWIMPFVALLPGEKPVFILSLGASIGLILRYAPYFYFGHWDDPVPLVKIWVSAIPIVVAVALAGAEFFRNRTRYFRGRPI